MEARGCSFSLRGREFYGKRVSASVTLLSPGAVRSAYTDAPPPPLPKRRRDLSKAK